MTDKIKLLCITGVLSLALTGTTTAQSNGKADQAPDDTLNGRKERTRIDDLQTRRQAKRWNAAGIGPAGLGNMGSRQVAYNMYYGGFWEVHPNAAIRGLGEATTDFADAIILSGNIGANFYLFNEEYSPYLGGELGLGWGYGEGQNAFGFDLGTAVGVQLFRLADTQMLVEAQTHILLDEIQGSFPLKYAARVGILF